MKSKMLRTRTLTAAATAALAGAPALADISPAGGFGSPVEYTIAASGATALGALTRGATTNSQNFPTGEQNGLWRLGINGLQIGRSTYTFGSGSNPVQLIGYRDVANPATGEIVNGENIRNHDRFVYSYHEVGSVNGVLETVKSGGLWKGGGNPLVNPGNPNQGYVKLLPDTPSQSAPTWRMGWPQINATTYVTTAAGGTATTAGGYAAAPQPLIRIGYSDVRSFQAFAFTSTDPQIGPSPERRPRDVAATAENDLFGYGQAYRSFNRQTGDAGTNYQALADRQNIFGEESGNPNASRLRNETLAVVPFALTANPGTGLGRIKEIEGKWLNATGRLPNGANFNTPTREIGSGTRNQGDNNMNLDPSWGGGERDRRSLAAGNVSDVDVNGNPVTIRPGDEMNPAKDLFGVDASNAASVQPKEHRVGPLMRFSDKSSGGSGIRPVTVNNRMAAGGILSVGDVGDRGIAGSAGSLSDPIRVLAIDWDEQPGELSGAAGSGSQYTQPTAIDTTTGRYQMWSEAQAVTVIGVDTDNNGTFDEIGTVGTDTANKPIFNDDIDHTGSVGTHRKFLNNITQAVSVFGQVNVQAFTPADAVIAAGFVPAQIMKVLKEFDGGIQTVRPGTGNTSNPAAADYDPDGDGLPDFDPDGAGPAISVDELYERLVNQNFAGNLKARLNWAAPEDINGNLAPGQTQNQYNIFAIDLANTAANSAATKRIPITTRTVLAGDMDGDGVRDLKDVEKLAEAYAASHAIGDISGAAALDTTTISPISLSAADTIVLTDFDGSGNISGTHAAPVFKAIDRNDVKLFLYGSMVDTGGRSQADPSYRYTGDAGTPVASPTTEERKQDGVRYGQLRKNEAIIRFNDKLSQLGAASLGFNRFDVNDDGVFNRADAKLVNDYIGKDIRSLQQTLDALQAGVDLVWLELNDNNVITHVDPNPGTSFNGTVAGLPNIAADSDFQHIRAALGAALLDGDTDFNGTVNIGDFSVLGARFNTAATRWSEADFNFDGSTTIGDFSLLAANFNLVAPGDGMRAAVPEPTAVSLLALGAVALMRRRRA